MEKKLRVFCLTLIFVVSSSDCKSRTPCATLSFEELNSFQITAEENTNYCLTFVLSYEEYARDKNYTIEVFKKTTSRELTPICNYRIRNRNCIPSAYCTCNVNGTHVVHTLVKSVTRYDEEWVFKSDISHTEEITSVILNVTYPVSIDQLTFEPHGSQLQKTADQNESVHVHCLFNKGNPVLKPTLLDRHGQVLESSVQSHGNMSRMSHQFHQVGCDDAGILSCEAPGTRENKTATLLVRCPPKFVKGQVQNVSMDGGQADVTFDIRTHTNVTTGCRLKFQDTENRTINCSQTVQVTGPPPDMTLTVHLVNMTIKDEGLWRLTVYNDVNVENADSADFWLVVQEHNPPTTSSNSDHAEQNTDGEETKSTHSKLYIHVIVALASLAVVTIVVVVVCCVRRRTKDIQRRHLATQRDAIEVQDRPCEQPEVAINNYEDGLQQRLINPENGRVRPSAKKRISIDRNAGEGRCQDGDTYVNVASARRCKVNKDEVLVHEDGAVGPSCSEQPAEYVDIRHIQKRRREAENECAASAASKTGLDGVSTSDEMNEEGLTYVQLDFSGRKARTTRNLVIHPLPRTDYAEVDFKAEPPPTPDDQ